MYTSQMPVSDSGTQVYVRWSWYVHIRLRDGCGFKQGDHMSVSDSVDLYKVVLCPYPIQWLRWVLFNFRCKTKGGPMSYAIPDSVGLT